MVGTLILLFFPLQASLPADGFSFAISHQGLLFLLHTVIPLRVLAKALGEVHFGAIKALSSFSFILYVL